MRATIPDLRGMREVTGYKVEGGDGELGHIADLIVDDETWAVRYLVVDTRKWWSGKKVSIAPQWARDISFSKEAIQTDIPREVLKKSPEWNPEQPVNREYETRLLRLLRPSGLLDQIKYRAARRPACNRLIRDRQLGGERPLSGRQVEIRHRDQRVVIVEVGGALREYSCGEQSDPRWLSRQRDVQRARGQTLIPWPNRLQDGRYTAGGVAMQLPLTEPEKQNAIHGLVRWDNWRVEAHEADRVVMSRVLHAQMGWPFVLQFSIEYSWRRTG